MPKIYPVIHHLNEHLTTSEAYKILQVPGIDGIFLISHAGRAATDWELVAKATELQADFPAQHIGVNLLSIPHARRVATVAAQARLDMVWFDKLGDLKAIAEITRPPEMTIFTGVAFKHQKQEADPVAAAETIRQVGFIPTTSGEATGIPPTVEKIRRLSADGNKPLAIASGMTPENVAAYAPYLSHILVATGVSKDMHRVDTAKLRAFIQAAK